MNIILVKPFIKNTVIALSFFFFLSNIIFITDAYNYAFTSANTHIHQHLVQLTNSIVYKHSDISDITELNDALSLNSTSLEDVISTVIRIPFEWCSVFLVVLAASLTSFNPDFLLYIIDKIPLPLIIFVPYICFWLIALTPRLVSLLLDTIEQEAQKLFKALREVLSI